MRWRMGWREIWKDGGNDGGKEGRTDGWKKELGRKGCEEMLMDIVGGGGGWNGRTVERGWSCSSSCQGGHRCTGPASTQSTTNQQLDTRESVDSITLQSDQANIRTALSDKELASNKARPGNRRRTDQQQAETSRGQKKQAVVRSSCSMVFFVFFLPTILALFNL